MCTTTSDFVFELNENPTLPSLPMDWVICDGGELLIDDDGAGTPGPNGGILTYSWNNTSVPAAFLITPTGSPASSEAMVTVVDGTSASFGEVTLTAFDQLGYG